MKRAMTDSWYDIHRLWNVSSSARNIRNNNSTTFADPYWAEKEVSRMEYDQWYRETQIDYIQLNRSLWVDPNEDSSACLNSTVRESDEAIEGLNRTRT